jgi:Domain of unknown function (DUF4340)
MKKLVPILLLAALVGFAYIYTNNGNRRLNSAALSGAPLRKLLFPDLAVNDIRKIRIREGSSQINLTAENGQWHVKERDGYTAAFDKIQRVLMALRELKIADKVSIGRSALADAQLLGPEEGAADRTGLSVDLMNEKGDVVAGFIAGKSETSSGGASSGQFMGGPGERRMVRTSNAADKDAVWWVADGFSEWKADPKDWVDKSFIDVRKIKSASVTAATPADSWSANRKTEEGSFELGDAKNGEELDTAKVGSLGSLLSMATYQDVLTKDKATADFMKGALSTKISTFEGFDYDIKVLDKKGDSEGENKTYLTVNVSAKINKTRTPEKDEKEEDKKKKDEEFAKSVKDLEDKLAKEKKAEGWVYEVSSYNVEVVKKKRSEILREKKADAQAPGSPAAPTPASGTPNLLKSLPAPTPVPAPAPVKAPVTVTTPPVSIEDAKPMPAAPANAPDMKAPTPADGGALKPAEMKPTPAPATAAKPEEPKPAPTPKPEEAKPAPAPAPTPEAAKPAGS